MDYQYNQTIYFDTRFSQAYARFLCYRPDKDTIVVDFHGSLHEFNPSEIRSTTVEEIIDYYDSHIKSCNKCIQDYYEMIRENKKKLKPAQNALRRYDIILAKLEDQRDAAKVACKLSETSVDSYFENQISKCHSYCFFTKHLVQTCIQNIQHYNTQTIKLIEEADEFKKKKEKFLKEGIYT